MQRRLCAVPHRLVQIVGVLFLAAVERHEACAVDPVGTARGAVVEHVVDPRAPEQRVVLQVFGILLVETRLLLLGHPVRTRLGLRRVALVSEESAAAVADARTQVGPVFLQLVAPYDHVVGRAAPPADVLLPDDQVGDEIDVAVLVAASDRRARGVHRAGRLVQPPDVGRHVVAAHPETREDTPHHHRRVVDVLGYDLLQLVQSVLFEGGRGEIGDVAQERRAVQRGVDPDEHSLFVATVVEVLRVRHYRRAQGVGSHRADDPQVGVVILRSQRAARKGVVVVERDAADGGAFSVDRQPFGRAGTDRAEARADGDAVGDAVLADGGRHGVERRVAQAPQRRIVHREGHGDGFAVEARLLAFREDPLSPRTGDVNVQRAAVVALRGDVHLDLALDLFGTDRLRVYEHAVRPEVERPP